MGTNAYEGVERLERCKEVIDGLKSAFPDAKKFSINIRFEWQETADYDEGAELCPVVEINVER